MHCKIDLLAREIKRYNPSLHLVSNKMLSQIESHIRDCMSVLQYIYEPIIADIGSGSGILSIPYKIMRPDAIVYAVERNHKKCIFLTHSIDLLELKDIEVIEADAATTAAGPFNAVMSRAFSPKSTLEKVALNLINPGGHFYYMSTHKAPPLSMEGAHLKKIIPSKKSPAKLFLFVYEL